jgi:hypothetical protein
MLNKSINYSNSIAESLNGNGGFGAKGLNESYENSILNRLDTIINDAKRQKAGVQDDKLHFLKFLNTDKVQMFSSLNENDKLKVITAFDNNSYYSTNDATKIFENALRVENLPAFISNMESYHKEMWNRLNESKQRSIVEQSKNYILDTQDKIDRFWETMDLRETKIELESVNENFEKDKLNQNDSYMKHFEEEMLSRMGR